MVWAHTRHPEGLLGRSDLPLRTAVGVPVCSIGFDLCILLMFSPGTRPSPLPSCPHPSPSTMSDPVGVISALTEEPSHYKCPFHVRSFHPHKHVPIIEST